MIRSGSGDVEVFSSRTVPFPNPTPNHLPQTPWAVSDSWTIRSRGCVTLLQQERLRVEQQQHGEFQVVPEPSRGHRRTRAVHQEHQGDHREVRYQTSVEDGVTCVRVVPPTSSIPAQTIVGSLDR